MNKKMEENIQKFIDKIEIVRRWYNKVTAGGGYSVSDEAIVILLDTLGAI